MVIQLIPLSPDLWTLLPGREAIKNLDALIGIEAWRPISLSPMKTANSLASLIVPLAALLLFAICRDAEKILITIMAMGLLSAILGVLQLFAASSSGVFLYEVTNRGSAVGFFANRNHHAVFLACCVLISLFLAVRRRASASYLNHASLLGFAVVLSAAILINGSRAGLISLGLVALLAAATAFFEPALLNGRAKRVGAQRVLAAAAAVAGLILFVIFALADRIPALSEFRAGSDYATELRAQVLPYLVEMARDVQPLGVGFGAFEYAYRMIEPTDLLGPSYLNNAHFDWLQFIIEGGVPAGLILCAGGAITAGRLLRLRTRHSDTPTRLSREALLGLGIMATLAVASLVDYPLRVPSMMVLGVIALAMFTRPDMDTEAGTRSVHRDRAQR
jgi:lipoprotein signal peptidase